MIGINNENTPSRQKRIISYVQLSIFRFFAIVITLLSNSKNVGFVSCSKDESNSKSDNDGNNYDIVGTWIG